MTSLRDTYIFLNKKEGYNQTIALLYNNMECIAEIKSEIIFASEKAKQDRHTIEGVDMDSFLDAILTLQKIFGDQSSTADKLASILRTQVCLISKEDFVLIEPLLKHLISSYDKLYVKIRKNSSIYSGVKTQIILFRNSIDNVKEVFNDMSVSRKLSDDKEYLKLVNYLNGF